MLYAVCVKLHCTLYTLHKNMSLMPAAVCKYKWATHRLEEEHHLVQCLLVLLSQQLELGSQLGGVDARQHRQQSLQGRLGNGGHGLKEQIRRNLTGGVAGRQAGRRTQSARSEAAGGGENSASTGC